MTSMYMAVISENHCFREVVKLPEGTAPKEKGLAQALQMAKLLLAGEGRRGKSVVLLSDGAPSSCPIKKPPQSEHEIATELENQLIPIIIKNIIPLASGTATTEAVASGSTTPSEKIPSSDNSAKNNMTKLTGNPEYVIDSNDVKKLYDAMLKALQDFHGTLPPGVTAVTTGGGETTLAGVTHWFADLGDGEDLSIVVIMDFTQSVEKYWKEEIENFIKFVNTAKNARFGVVSLSCPSVTLLPMGVHEEKQIRACNNSVRPFPSQNSLVNPFGSRESAK
ncbi:hypothetical protein GCK32_014944 [Trichostrongylus colubriformis]|uniref:Uncharacterized protein n=1 Tax=Trichostrongylus colubriformis TaxID=6319 RepID=A0AAN8ESA1_TRICO